MARTRARVTARERARQSRLKLDEERQRRDNQIEELAATYFRAADQHEQIATQLAPLLTAMSDTVTKLLNMGESQSRVAALLGLDPVEVRGIRKLAQDPKASPGGGEEARAQRATPTQDPQAHTEAKRIHRTAAQPPATEPESSS